MPRTLAEHLDPAVQPKRILSLDGGGLRGVLTLAFLQRIEDLLRQRPGTGDAFRLCDHYDLIGGTSTGSIIAAGLALGMRVGEIREQYFRMGRDVFRSSLLRLPFFSQKFDAAKVTAALHEVFGDRTLDSPDLRTGLMVMCKRLDTGSPWPLSNNPKAPYFAAGSDRHTIPNGKYSLVSVVRASTAAPTYFRPEDIAIRAGDPESGAVAVTGEFVDGGISTANNPALQLVLMATVKGYGFGWEMGADRLSVTSLGTGRSNPELGRGDNEAAVAGGIKALKSVLEDCEDQVEVMMQWMSRSPTARRIDRAMGDLDGCCVGGAPSLQYLRYNVHFEPGWFRRELGREMGREQLDQLALMDQPGNMDELEAIGREAALRFIQPEHLAAV